MKRQTREPIISVLGHVDHGKTTLLDFIRKTVVASREAGGITQHIGATEIPFEVIKKVTKGLLKDEQVKLPLRGLLFIDTPGHESFTSLRKRGGAVADIVILVVDIRDGLKPQSLESLKLLRQTKTPFIIAANKIDLIPGWRRGDKPLNQPTHVKDEYLRLLYKLIGELSAQNFNCDLYDQISDFRKQIAIVPLSAETGQGVPNLLMVLIGLTQQYLASQLDVGLSTPAAGTILEVRQTQGLGTTVDAIIYEGTIKVGDEIVLGGHPPIQSKVKALLRPQALDEMRDPKKKFKPVDEVYAASGVKIVAPSLEDAIAGSPVYVGGRHAADRIAQEMETLEFDRETQGLVIKADTLGSLEAILKMLEERGIQVKKAGIGKVNRTDVVEASSVSAKNPYLGVVVAFHTPVLDDARKEAEKQKVKVFEDKVVYKIIEDYELWVSQKKKKARTQLDETSCLPVKLRVLPGHVFRQSKPAVVGVEILEGTLLVSTPLMQMDGKSVGRVREIQNQGEKIDKAERGEKIAISIEGATVGRQLNEQDTLYSSLSIDDLGKLKGADLKPTEKQAYSEVVSLIKKR
ncbi:MAG: translation initiation factor IF-2 [Candidatus Altiarchaeales archaeon]|nr:translation initiation factor IF-2 [Candidatus Altiarchaeales archaeon]